MMRPNGRAALLALLWWAVASPAAALPLISEVFYDAPGSDDGAVFVELFGTPGVSLAGLRLEGVNGAGGGITTSVSLSGVFPADGIFVVADAAASGATQVVGADQVADFDFQNGPDSVVLRAGSQVLDALGYGVFKAGEVFAGEGAPAPDAAAGESLARRFANRDTGDNARDFQVQATPTPGVAPRAVPEPQTAGLLALALLALLRRRH